MGLTYEEAKKVAEQKGETVIPTICAMCGPKDACGIYAFVKDGIFTRVAGMNECPINKGAVCAKGNAAPQWVYAKERITRPLVRVGEKGEGKFREVSWDEAMTILTEKLKEQKEKYGPESLAILSPARRGYSEYMQRFLIAHGSPNYGHSGICALQRAFGMSYTLGSNMRTCDYANADMIIYWAKQPIFSGPATGSARNMMAAIQRGAKIIGIKPTLEPDSDKMDEWLPLRPGSDAALALGMLHVVTKEDLIDHDFVESWCYGYDELKVHVKQYTPEWAERITGVPAQQIVRVAREYATTKAACIDLGNGIEHSASASDGIRAIAILMAITGHVDRKGCNLFGPGKSEMPKAADLKLHARITKEMVDKLVGPEFPRSFQPFVEGTTSAYYRILDSVLTEDPYPIRCVIAPGTQPAVSTRNTKRILEALKKLEFYVVVDVTRTADMDYADLVIPTATMYESDMPLETSSNWIMARNKVIEPLGDYKSIYEFFIELGERMGYGNDFWHGSKEDWQEFLLAPFDMTMEQLREYKCGRQYPLKEKVYENYETFFQGKSTRLGHGPYLEQGKAALYSTILEKNGYAPMPVWRENPESLTNKACEELREKYPLLLSDYHTSKVYSAGWLRNVAQLRECDPYPCLHIHPETAKERGIRDGDWVKVESRAGWLKVKAEYYPGTRPDTVMLLHGWWQGCDKLGISDMPLTDGGANVNNLYYMEEGSFDPLVTAMSSQALVEVSKYIDEAEGVETE